MGLRSPASIEVMEAGSIVSSRLWARREREEDVEHSDDPPGPGVPWAGPMAGGGFPLLIFRRCLDSCAIYARRMAAMKCPALPPKV